MSTENTPKRSDEGFYAHACRVGNPGMTPDEWQDYLDCCLNIDALNKSRYSLIWKLADKFWGKPIARLKGKTKGQQR